jgi:hypothetical protein
VLYFWFVMILGRGSCLVREASAFKFVILGFGVYVLAWRWREVGKKGVYKE